MAFRRTNTDLSADSLHRSMLMVGRRLSRNLDSSPPPNLSQFPKAFPSNLQPQQHREVKNPISASPTRLGWLHRRQPSKPTREVPVDGGGNEGNVGRGRMELKRSESLGKFQAPPPPPLIPPQGRSPVDEQAAMHKCMEELRKRREER